MRYVTNRIVDLIEKMPDALIWRFARRYIAGVDYEAALQAMREIQADGMLATMDVLGEDTNSETSADAACRDYLDLIRAMNQANLPGNVSLKPTQLGLKLKADVAFERIRNVAIHANRSGYFFRLDMEDATTTDRTIEWYRRLRRELPQTGIVIQAYLKRSPEDVRNLMDEGSANIRICKGIYRESSDIAFSSRDLIRKRFLELLRMILDAKSYPAIATHDPFLIRGALEEIRRRKLAPEDYEFQMLHGVGFGWRKKLLADGHRLRIYVPFGAAWRAYSLRRFRENPTLALYVLKNLVVPL
ncbi:proline dehydrogenase family protein [bacterium]|nr:proline dehydrogenase family protein [candidate division CSSED10-310 bacterium]